MGHYRQVGAVDFSPDGKLVVIGADTGATLRDSATGDQIGRPLGHGSHMFAVRFSPDGSRVLTASEDRTARVWDVATGLAVTPPLQHDLAVWRGEFSPDGLRVVTASDDGTARVWDARTGEPLSPPFRHTKPVLVASFSPNGQHIVTATLHGAQVWDVPISDWNSVELAAMAQLAAGAQIGAGEQIQPLEPAQRDAAWAAVSSRFETIGAAESTTALWHRRRLVVSREMADWFAAEFHARRLAELLPGDVAAASDLAHVLEVKPAPRDPVTPAECIDLSDFYNASLLTTWNEGAMDNNLAELPRGIQTLAGTRFDIRGLIQVEAHPQAFDIHHYPIQVKGIAVHRKLNRLHFLQAAHASGQRTGYYLIHYANGRSEEIPIRFNEDTSDWWESPELPRDLPNAVVAWRGANPYSRLHLNRKIRFFKRTWNNPAPEVEITKLDFIADQGEPFLVALTAE